MAAGLSSGPGGTEGLCKGGGTRCAPCQHPAGRELRPQPLRVALLGVQLEPSPVALLPQSSPFLLRLSFCPLALPGTGRKGPTSLHRIVFCLKGLDLLPSKGGGQSCIQRDPASGEGILQLFRTQEERLWGAQGLAPGQSRVVLGWARALGRNAEAFRMQRLVTSVAEDSESQAAGGQPGYCGERARRKETHGGGGGSSSWACVLSAQT